MLQTIENPDGSPLSNLVAHFLGVAEYTFGASVRSLKRLFGQEVTPRDYNQIWAETREDGSVVHGSVSDTPEFVLCATRDGNSDNWVVERQKRGADIVIPSQLIIVGDINAIPNCIIVPSYECVEDLGVLSTEQVQSLMSAADPDSRSSPSHYSRAFGMK